MVSLTGSVGGGRDAGDSRSTKFDRAKGDDLSLCTIELRDEEHT